MSYTHGTVVEAFESADRKAKLDFIARDDGFYEFREHVEMIDDNPSNYSTYWGERIFSGIFQTLALARSDAADRIAWFRDGH